LRKNVETTQQQANLELMFVCEICAYTTEATDEDTLMASISLREEQSLYKSEIYLNLAGKDKIAPLVKKPCKNPLGCDNERLKKIHLIATGETVYICTKCDHRFL
jgi:rubrerythrin